MDSEKLDGPPPPPPDWDSDFHGEGSRVWLVAYIGLCLTARALVVYVMLMR